MRTRVNVTRKDAEKVLAAVKKQFAGYLYDGAEQPKIIENFEWGTNYTEPFVIAWEGGPYEWALLAANGGVDQELASMVEEFGGKPPKALAPIEAPGLSLQPVYSWALSIEVGG